MQTPTIPSLSSYKTGETDSASSLGAPREFCGGSVPGPIAHEHASQHSPVVWTYRVMGTGQLCSAGRRPRVSQNTLGGEGQLSNCPPIGVTSSLPLGFTYTETGPAQETCLFLTSWKHALGDPSLRPELTRRLHQTSQCFPTSIDALRGQTCWSLCLSPASLPVREKERRGEGGIDLLLGFICV